eukprot:scaffold169930_cov28-Tisochrysis_lutea.AAC.4
MAPTGTGANGVCLALSCCSPPTIALGLKYGALACEEIINGEHRFSSQIDGSALRLSKSAAQS